MQRDNLLRNSFVVSLFINAAFIACLGSAGVPKPHPAVVRPVVSVPTRLVELEETAADKPATSSGQKADDSEPAPDHKVYHAPPVKARGTHGSYSKSPVVNIARGSPLGLTAGRLVREHIVSMSTSRNATHTPPTMARPPHATALRLPIPKPVNRTVAARALPKVTKTGRLPAPHVTKTSRLFAPHSVPKVIARPAAHGNSVHNPSIAAHPVTTAEHPTTPKTQPTAHSVAKKVPHKLGQEMSGPHSKAATAHAPVATAKPAASPAEAHHTGAEHPDTPGNHLPAANSVAHHTGTGPDIPGSGATGGHPTDAHHDGHGGGQTVTAQSHPSVANGSRAGSIHHEAGNGTSATVTEDHAGLNASNKLKGVHSAEAPSANNAASSSDQAAHVPESGDAAGPHGQGGVAGVGHIGGGTGQSTSVSHGRSTDFSGQQELQARYEQLARGPLHGLDHEGVAHDPGSEPSAPTRALHLPESNGDPGHMFPGVLVPREIWRRVVSPKAHHGLPDPMGAPTGAAIKPTPFRLVLNTVGSHSLRGNIPWPSDNPKPSRGVKKSKTKEQAARSLLGKGQVEGGGDGSGLLGEYFIGRNFEQPQFKRPDPYINFIWTGTQVDPRLPQGVPFSVRWLGKVCPRFSETYTFYTGSDDGVVLYVDNKCLISNWTIHGITEDVGSITLVAGKKYPIKLEYFEKNGFSNEIIKLYWESPSQPKEYVPESCLFYPKVEDDSTNQLVESPVPAPAN